MQVAVVLALALAAQVGASEALKERDAEVRAALPKSGEPSPSARKSIEAIVTKTVDLEAMLQAALGARWKELSERQRKRLVAAFETRFRQLSGRELDAYRSTEIEYLPEKDGEGGVVHVPTKVTVKGEPTEIAYTMRLAKGRWRIVDISVDGVSTVQNYRSSFNRVIQKEGVEGLIRRLEKGSVGTKSTAGGPQQRNGEAMRHFDGSPFRRYKARR
jgi:phospholipid transport system substrate-binding protein